MKVYTKEDMLGNEELLKEFMTQVNIEVRDAELFVGKKRQIRRIKEKTATRI